MPSVIFGPIHFDSVDGVAEFGDCLTIEPKNTSKTYAGSGSFNTGDFHIENNIFSVTNGIDPDAVDTSNVANN